MKFKKFIILCLIFNNSLSANFFENDKNFNIFDFLKFDENLIEFLISGDALLYIGISLVSFSISGIVFTALPDSLKKFHKKDKFSKLKNR